MVRRSPQRCRSPSASAPPTMPRRERIVTDRARSIADAPFGRRARRPGARKRDRASADCAATTSDHSSRGKIGIGPRPPPGVEISRRVAGALISVGITSKLFAADFHRQDGAHHRRVQPSLRRRCCEADAQGVATRGSSFEDRGDGADRSRPSFYISPSGIATLLCRLRLRRAGRYRPTGW